MFSLFSQEETASLPLREVCYKVVSFKEIRAMLKRQGKQVLLFYFNNLLEEDPVSTVGFPQSVNKESSSNNVFFFGVTVFQAKCGMKLLVESGCSQIY